MSARRRVMGSTGKRWPALLVATAAAGAGASCSLGLGYPDPQAENTAELCSNGIDDDFNGLVDCQEASCNGFCPEQSAASCTDGQDNDGDGLVDGADPRCWPVESPLTTRCASSDAVRFEERFDAELSSARWYTFGTLPDSGEPVAQVQDPGDRADRPDHVLGFSTRAPATGVLGGLGSTVLLDGDFATLDLSFSARLVDLGLGRVALVPAALAPPGEAPGSSAEAASILVELDASSELPLALVLGGERHGLAWGDPAQWHAVRLSAHDDALRLSLDETTSLEVPRPAVPISRLVVWGNATPLTGTAGAVQLDDLSVVLGGSRPCAAPSPQIPLGSACRQQWSKLGEEVGFTISLAGSPDGALCAMLTSAAVGESRPSGAQSWTSPDGDTWSFGGLLPGASDQQLVGAAVAFAAGASQFRAVVAELGHDAVRLAVTTSDDCASWSPRIDAADLPLDAEAPSYVVPGLEAAHEVYFTRPPRDTAERTLWRLRSDDGQLFTLDPSPVAELRAELGTSAPVTLSRLTSHHWALTYPVSPATGQSGLGLAVAMDDALGDWQPTERWPLLAQSSVAGGFDGSAIVAGAPWWTGSAGFVLYSGLGAPYPYAAAGRSAPLTTGTARLTAAGAEPPAGTAPQGSDQCGDGTCQPSEACEACPIDCGVCDGELVYDDAFTAPERWLALSPASAAPAASMYVSPVLGSLDLEPSHAGWMVHALDWPLEGDFELSFDVRVVAPSVESPAERCTLQIGVGRAPTRSAMDPDGVFAQIDQSLPCTLGAPAFSARAHIGGRRLSSLSLDAEGAASDAPCTGLLVGQTEASHHVVLRRENGRVSVRVIGADGCDSSALDAAQVDYVGALPALDTVLIGFAAKFGPTGWTSSCARSTASVSVDNLVLRTLACSAATTACDVPSTDRTVCVALDSSPEHCGACFTPVGQAEVCTAGAPVCAGTLCPDPLGTGPDVCVDLRQSAENCGACGVTLAEHEACVNGLRQAKMVLVPDGLPADAPDGYGYWIDTTEVTREQYAAWLATDPSPADQPAWCLPWNSSYEPTCGWPVGDSPNHPVVCIDWCDAYSYCQGVGKRLCGRIGGGGDGAGYWDAQGTTTDQWYRSCSSGGKYLFPYGNAYKMQWCAVKGNDGITCVGSGQFPACEELEVGSLSTCQSPDAAYAGVYDMSGNAAEWVDGCDGNHGPQDQCRPSGGGSNGASGYVSCSYIGPAPREMHNYWVGFRCCAL
jgi:formylglycine-generating enzyme